MKQRRRREEIERWLEVRDREGLTIRETADRAGIPAGTLSWWTHRLRQERRAGFVEVVPVLDADDPDEELAHEVDNAAACVLRLPGGLVLEARGAVAELLSDRVIAGLGSCS